MPTALIVEDEPEANKLLAMLIALRGYRTESAFLGAEALQKIRDQAPDVVFLDLMLPDMNGYDVCRALQSSAPGTLIPVVIVTARLAAENRIASFEVGADDYIPKPYTPDQIFEAVEQSAAWKERLALPQLDGTVCLDARDDGETLRALAQLRRLLLARSGLAADEIDRIKTAIKELWTAVDGWSRRHRVDQVATLEYALSRESLALTVHDEAGWLTSAGEMLAAPASSIVAEARFDEVIADQEKRQLKMVKRLPSH
jgi:CheY-like chemotaxis protein